MTKTSLYAFVFSAVMTAVFLRPAPAVADAREDGQAAYDRGDYGTALKLWSPLAQKGDPEAEKAVGWLYATGHGVKQDYAQAFKWYKKAAAQGLAEAQFNLGVLYENGIGITKDYAEAFTWYQRAAAQQDAAAQDNLGWMCQYGWGTRLNYVEAYKWYSLAARAEDEEERRIAEEDRVQLAPQMTASQIAEAERLAKDWKPAKP
jgi:hypothetical protein